MSSKWNLVFRLTVSSGLLAACVTHAPSPVGDALLSYCAPPSLSVAVTDPDGLPALYDEAMHAALAAGDAPGEGFAARKAAETVEAAMGPSLARYAGAAPCALSVSVENVILPDATRYTMLSGMKSFGVSFALTGPDGTVLAETTRPFTVLSAPQKSGRFAGSAWRRPGNTADLRVEAVLSLSEATALVVGEAMTGGRTQSGLSGRLVAYPERAR